MEKKTLVLLSILLINVNIYGIERTRFYPVFSSESAENISNLIVQIEDEETSTSLANAYRGALYMKLSSLLPTPKSKLDAFKQGRNLLEKEIQNQPGNIEYRFLRLVIQEQSPALVKYKSKIKSDKELIISHYSKLDHFVQKQVINYARQSKSLNEKDLKP